MNLRIRVIFAALLAMGWVSGSVPAGTILLVSDCSAPGTYTGTAPTNVPERDNSLVAFLEGLGHTVDTRAMGMAFRGNNQNYPQRSPFDPANPDKLQALLDADLVIVSRHTTAGQYNKDRKDWNELETPLLLMSGPVTRGSSDNKMWGWTNGNAATAGKKQTDLTINAGQEGHPFLAGLTSPVTLFDWSDAPTPGEAPKGVSLPKKDGTAEPVPGAVVLGTFGGRTMLMDIPKGTDFNAGNTSGADYGVAGGRRAFLATWGYDITLDYPDPMPDREATFDDFLTDDYKTLLGNTVTTLIPEPATASLLALGSLALLRRRR